MGDGRKNVKGRRALHWHVDVGPNERVGRVRTSGASHEGMAARAPGTSSGRPLQRPRSAATRPWSCPSSGSLGACPTPKARFRGIDFPQVRRSRPDLADHLCPRQPVPYVPCLIEAQLPVTGDDPRRGARVPGSHRLRGAPRTESIRPLRRQIHGAKRNRNRFGALFTTVAPIQPACSVAHFLGRLSSCCPAMP